MSIISPLSILLMLYGSSVAPVEEQRNDPNDPQQQQTVTEYVYVEGSLPYVPSSNTIVTKLPLDRQKTPNNIGYVTETLAREQFDRVLSDALVNVSNVNVQSQNGVHDFFLIRGFDSLSSGLVLIDGASEPEATFYQMYNVELVEVLKGPGGFLYGSNPLSGAVNLVRKQPVPANLFRFSGSAGSFDSYEGSFDWNVGDLDRPVSFRLNGLVRDVGSYRDGKEGQTVAINPSVKIRTEDRGTFDINFEYLDVDVVPDSGIPVLGETAAPVDAATNYQSDLETSQQEIFRLQADYEYEINDWLTVRDKFYYRKLDWKSDATIFNGFVPTGINTAGVIRTLGQLDDGQTFTGNQLEAIFAFETGGLRHSLLTGLELARFANVFTLDFGVLGLVDVLNPVEPGMPPIPFPDASLAGDARTIVAAPYAIDQIEVGDKVNLLLGARLDGLDFEESSSGFSRSDNEVSPMAGLLFAPTPELSLYGNFSRSFAPPSARVVTELVPERATQYEVGVKRRFDRGRAELAFAVYQLERDNIAIPDDNGFTQQVGNQRSRGFELDLVMEPASDFRTLLSYAYNDAELTNFSEIVVSVFPPGASIFDRTGNRPAFAPQHVLNLWVSKDFRNWGLGGGARYLSSQFIAEDNVFSIDGTFLLDATLYYDIGDLRLRVNLKNITDEEYFYRGFGSVSVIPAPPFAAYFGFDYQL